MTPNNSDGAEGNGDTERKRAGDRLLAAVVEQSDAIVVVKDLSLRVVAANPAFAKAAGFSSPDDLIGKTDAEIFGVPSGSEPVRSYMEDERRAQTLSPGESIVREEPVRTASGELRYVLTHKYPLFDENGALIGTGNISADITVRKAAEEALRSSERYLRTILNTTMDGFWVIDARGRIVDVNDAYCAMSGYSREEILSMGIVDLDPFEDPVETAERIARIVRNGSEIFERRHRRKDGSVMDVELSVSWLDVDGGQIVCFCRDITPGANAPKPRSPLRRSRPRPPTPPTPHSRTSSERILPKTLSVSRIPISFIRKTAKKADGGCSCSCGRIRSRSSFRFACTACSAPEERNPWSNPPPRSPSPRRFFPPPEAESVEGGAAHDGGVRHDPDAPDHRELRAPQGADGA